MKRTGYVSALAPLVLLLSLGACAPRVAVEAPKEPIVINVNVTMDVRVRIEKDVDALIEENKELF